MLEELCREQNPQQGPWGRQCSSRAATAAPRAATAAQPDGDTGESWGWGQGWDEGWHELTSTGTLNRGPSLFSKHLFPLAPHSSGGDSVPNPPAPGSFWGRKEETFWEVLGKSWCLVQMWSEQSAGKRRPLEPGSSGSTLSPYLHFHLPNMKCLALLHLRKGLVTS